MKKICFVIFLLFLSLFLYGQQKKDIRKNKGSVKSDIEFQVSLEEKETISAKDLIREIWKDPKNRFSILKTMQKASLDQFSQTEFLNLSGLIKNAFEKEGIGEDGIEEYIYAFLIKKFGENEKEPQDGSKYAGHSYGDYGEKRMLILFQNSHTTVYLNALGNLMIEGERVSEKSAMQYMDLGEIAKHKFDIPLGKMEDYYWTNVAEYYTKEDYEYARIHEISVFRAGLRNRARMFADFLKQFMKDSSAMQSGFILSKKKIALERGNEDILTLIGVSDYGALYTKKQSVQLYTELFVQDTSGKNLGRDITALHVSGGRNIPIVFSENPLRDGIDVMDVRIEKYMTLQYGYNTHPTVFDIEIPTCATFFSDSIIKYMSVLLSKKNEKEIRNTWASWLKSFDEKDTVKMLKALREKYIPPVMHHTMYLDTGGVKKIAYHIIMVRSPGARYTYHTFFIPAQRVTGRDFEEFYDNPFDIRRKKPRTFRISIPLL